MPDATNLFAALPAAATGEDFADLLSRPGVRIERIVSRGHASPPGFWYEQPHGEWVVVLRGEAHLAFEDENAPRVLKTGDFIDIAPRRRHRVAWTDPGALTVWLAVHYGDLPIDGACSAADTRADAD